MNIRNLSSCYNRSTVYSILHSFYYYAKMLSINLSVVFFLKSFIMGFFLLTTSLGNLLIVTITILGSGKGDESVSSGRFYFYAAMMAVVGLLFIIIAARYRYRDEPVPIGK